MSDLNQITMLGRLTRDPQLKYTPSQVAICEFGIAAGHKYKAGNGEARESTCFVDCVLFGKRAEALNQYFNKGKQILIRGRLDFQTWDDKNGGGKRSKHVIQVEDFFFTGTKGDGGSRGSEQGRAPADNQRHPADEPPGFADDDIPF